MSKFVIEGGKSLKGEIYVAGNKNAALPIIAATVLTDETCVLENLPEIRDVHVMLELLKDIGKSVVRTSPMVYKISGSISKTEIDQKFASKLRASVLLLGAMLVKAKEVLLPPPGGCVIGRRNLNTHFEICEAFGSQVDIDDKGYRASVLKPHPGEIFLKEQSVTGTGNALLISSGIPGKTVIENAASEPHIGDLVNVLLKMGAEISGSGTNRLQINGVANLKGFQHRIVSDHIEAGTLAIAAACTQSELIIHEANKKHLVMTDFYLKQMNVKSEFIDEKTLQIKPSDLIARIKKIQVGLWPGFPTDLMSPFIVLATQTKGTTLCHDWMYESRMFFVDKLSIMGAEIVQCDPHRVIVTGPSKLRGQELSSPDIRAGIALVIAALSARGKSTIDRVELIDRGYMEIEKRLSGIGASIKRIE
jgi:UDP-N-acetylglucosamine 1-carboxyvinyltransferase